MKLTVVYSSDDAYAQHAGVSMTSLFEHHRRAESIHAYMISNGISPGNRSRLEAVCAAYGRRLTFVDFETLAPKLRLNIGGSISASSYARLFIAGIVGPDEERALYLDCDTIVTGNLEALWKMDLGDACIAGVRDTVGARTKREIGIGEDDLYVNAGVLLIDVRKWRERGVEAKFLRFIDERGGRVYHHDQGAINGVLHGECMPLPPKYNAMSVLFSMRREELLAYYGMEGYYDEAELDEAIASPAVLHYTPAFVGRPWVRGCKHPYRRAYLASLDKSPWRGAPPQADRRSAAERGVAAMYAYFPFRVANRIRRAVFK